MVSRFAVGSFAAPGPTSSTETVAVTHVAGPTDLLVHVAVTDGDHLRNLVMDSFTTRPEVARFETSLVYSHQRVGR